MIRLLLVLIAATFSFSPAAMAQSRDVYTVRGLTVDERATTVIEAQQKAFAAAKYAGALQLIDRITLPEDLAAAEGLILDQASADLMAAAVDIEEETAGAGRYRGRLSVVFNPVNVRAFLDRNGIPYTDRQAPKAVIIPVASPRYQSTWISTWPDASSGQLAPTVTSRSFGYSANSTWDDISADTALYGAQRGVLAELLGAPGSYRVKVSSVTPSGVIELGTTQRVGSMQEAVRAAGALLDGEWKRNSVVRETGRTLIESTVLYTSLAEWNTLRSALAQSPLVSDFKTKAVSRDGAVVAFVFAGDGQRLVSDLRDRGVVIQMDPIGWVMRSAVTAGR